MSIFLRICVCTAAMAAAATFVFADDQPAPPTMPTDTSAAPAAPAAPAADPNDPNDPNKIICKREKMTGTRVANAKVCMTRKQWDELAQESAEDAGRLQRQQDMRNSAGPPSAVK